MSGLKVVLFVGSVRDQRLGQRAVNFLMSKLKETPHHVDVFGECSLTGSLLNYRFTELAHLDPQITGVSLLFMDGWQHCDISFVKISQLSAVKMYFYL